MENNIANHIGKYVIIRSDRAGVFAGTLADKQTYNGGCEVTLTNVRQLWHWVGAASLSQLALEGVKKPEDCKFTVTNPAITIFGVIEIIPCTDTAEQNIKAVPEWKM